MPISDILVCVDHSQAGEKRLNRALNVARAHNSYLSAAYVMTNGQRAPASAGEPGSGALIEAGLRDADAAEDAERRFASALRQRGIEGEWRLLADDAQPRLIELAQSVDLTIVGQRPRNPRAADGAASIRPDDVVVATGRPVLVVPYAGAFERVGKRALIAWDGTREANRAVNDAVPLLAEADGATVIFVGAQEAQLERTRPSLERICGHLQRHRIDAKPEEALKGDLAVSDLLLSRAADLDADLIIAGGYHHSPLREALLGGVSRELLEHMTVPVLMSH
jgi:nucleotide-binding universal stress UspA family protein